MLVAVVVAVLLRMVVLVDVAVAVLAVRLLVLVVLVDGVVAVAVMAVLEELKQEQHQLEVVEVA